MPASLLPRVVFDCNIFLQSMLSKHGPAARCLQFVHDGRVRLFISEYVFAEVRKLPHHKKLARFSKLTEDKIEAYISDIIPKAILLPEVPALFRLERDPADAHYVDLAIAADASYIVTRDKDLLDLMNLPDFRDRFPKIRVVTPVDLLNKVSGFTADSIEPVPPP